MSPVISVSAPASSTMNRGHNHGVHDTSYTAQMAQYNRELAEFNESPYRQACECLAFNALCAGTLGVCVASPIVGNVVASDAVFVGVFAGSVASCLGGVGCLTQARIPVEPEDPENPRQTSA
jgi:hypothetical protein